jgi:xanthine dehydrogenase accessory factor
MFVLQAATEAMAAGRPAALVTVTHVNGSAPRHGGARMVVHGDGSIVGSIGGGAWEHRVIAEALAALATGAPRSIRAHLTRDLGMCCGGAMEAFVEPLESTPDLVVYGAGHVGAATARMAAAAGFRVTVVDERDELLEDAALPDRVNRVEGDPRRLLAQLPSGPLSHHLVVTHDHSLDQDLVERLLPTDLAWVGLIASRAKVTRFFVRFRASGMDPALFTRLSAPVGLDIGAETPEEIAVSIVAELIRVRRRAHRTPAPLSATDLPARGGSAVAPALRGPIKG